MVILIHLVTMTVALFLLARSTSPSTIGLMCIITLQEWDFSSYIYSEPSKQSRKIRQWLRRTSRDYYGLCPSSKRTLSADSTFYVNIHSYLLDGPL